MLATKFHTQYIYIYKDLEGDSIFQGDKPNICKNTLRKRTAALKRNLNQPYSDYTIEMYPTKGRLGSRFSEVRTIITALLYRRSVAAIPTALRTGRSGVRIQAVKWPQREVNHSPPSNGDVRNEWRYNSSPPYMPS